MNARQRVIAALGGRCAWCQSTAGPFEIDHTHDGGNQHRAQLHLAYCARRAPRQDG